MRYRIDGILKEMMDLPQAGAPRADQPLQDHERPEHFGTPPAAGRAHRLSRNSIRRFDLDLRVSTAPMNHGEKVCAAYSRQDEVRPCRSTLGFSDYNFEMYRELIQSPYGMILHCGPTGSGKSMTLYSALNEINSPDWNIITAEDPIEYTLPGLNQMQVQEGHRPDLRRALRSLSCDRIRTSSSSAKSAIRKRRKSRSKRR